VPCGNEEPATILAMSRHREQIFVASDGRHEPSVPLSSATPREVVVVEDDVDAREALSKLLASHGYSVTSAGNGREALDYLRRSYLPGLIILDLMMPLMDGWEFLEHQSRDPALLDIPVVVLSATAPHQPLTAKAILMKPVQPKELFKMIERYLPPKR
jgi:CheY-like chemotaxis protein